MIRVDGLSLKLMQALEAAKIAHSLTKTPEGYYAVQISGWYKHGNVNAIEYDTGLVIQGRYGPLGEINAEADIMPTLARLNAAEWRKFSNRFDGWNQPDGQWINTLLHYGEIEEETKKIYR